MASDPILSIPADMPPSDNFDSIRVPKIEGRRALLILNCQTDAFIGERGPNIIGPPDFLSRIRNIIPHYRKTDTEIVWVQTEVPAKKTDANDGSNHVDIRGYMPSRQQEERLYSLSEAEREQKKTAQAREWKDNQNVMPTWTKTENGNEIVAELADMLDSERDIVIEKRYWSAFDETPLLMGLRMKMVTEIHICGCLSNVSIAHTATEAARHGFRVGVVEDCMGYQNEALHLEAMQKMADDVGVHGVDSNEVVEEAGGNAPPDADPDIFSGPGFSGINITPNKMEDDRRTPHSKDVLVKRKPKSSRQTSDQEAITLTTKAKIGEGDCKVITNALVPDLAVHAFEKLKTEVQWLAMKHRTGDVPRRVAVQGEVGADGGVPVYRHPADVCPPLKQFSPTVLAIRDDVSKILNQPFNHVLIQLYRTGQDNISEHSDKTLDIVRASNIINVSLGAQRKMTLRLKKSALSSEQQARGDPREAQKVTMPHNSIFVLGPRTNTRWLHGVRPDKRPEVEKIEEEKAFDGERISLTFRNIGTWTDEERKKIWGQGARKKTRNEIEEGDGKSDAGNVKPADSDEAERMVIAFGRENHRVDFDWEKEYGEGFDALDLVVINPAAA